MLNDTPSITTYLGGANATVQDVSLTHHNRGVFIDGTLIAKPTFPWRLEGNPWAQDYYNEKAWWGDNIRLATGTYQVTAIDLELPAPGFTWPIARSYNARQHNGSTYVTSPGYQGNNWFQMSQPQLVFLDNDSSASTREIEDRLFLIYGADRYIEFLRVNDDVDEFRAINGAAGVIQHVVNSSAPDLYTYYDPFGTETVFFGIADADIADEKEGMLWKISDPAGNVAYVGHETSATTALSSGYDSSGRIVEAFDTAGRMYTYEYFGGMLMIVTAEVNTGSGWKEVGRVNYDYYDGIESFGEEDDLKYAITTLPIVTEGTTTHNDIRTTYYRYLADSKIQYVLEPEGTRNYDWSDDGAFNLGYESAGESAIKPYAAAAFTSYDSDRRITAAFFNGECGCSGGVDGQHKFTYGDSTYYSSNSLSTYDTFWASRTRVELPVEPNGSDVAFFTYYFDEIGQPLGRVIVNGEVVSGTPTFPTSFDVAEPDQDTWAAWVRRNAAGQITELHAHTNTASYSHSLTTEEPLTLYASTSADAGLVLHFERVASGGTKGFVSTRRHSKGTITPGSAYLDDAMEYSTRTRSIGSATLTRPLVTADWQYQEGDATSAPGGTPPSGASKLSIATAFFSDVATNRAYLAAKTETVTWPAVSTLQNGSGSTDDEVWYFRKDGTIAFHEATDGVFTHWSQDDVGLTDLIIADAKTNSSQFDAADDAMFTDWGITASGVGLHEDVSYEYDEQGRLTQTTRHPGGTAGTHPHRVMPKHHHVLADRRLVVLDIPVEDTTPKFYGPVGYVVYNHAGSIEVNATIAITGAGTTTTPINWIDEAESDPIEAVLTGSVAHLTTSHYGDAGLRLDEMRTFHTIPTSLASPASTIYDPTTYEYDDRGRLQVSTTPKGTVLEYVHDVRGNYVTERYIGDGAESFPGGLRSQFIRPSPRTGGPGRTVRPQDIMASQHPVNQMPVNQDQGGGSGPEDGDSGSGDTDGEPTETQCVWIVWESSSGAAILHRDYLGRIVFRQNPQAPHALVSFDNLNRITAIGLYSSSAGLNAGDDPVSTTTSRVGLVEFEYDVRGTPWRVTKHEVDYDSGATTMSELQTLVWADERGRIVKRDGGTLEKTVFDVLGREIRRYTLAKDNDSSYADATAPEPSGDHVLEDRQWAYEAHTGNVLLSAVVRRHHGDTTTTGSLDDNGDGSSLKITDSDLEGRADIAAFWYDSQDRLVDEVRLGTFGLNETGGNSNYNRQSASAPARSDTALRRSYTYNIDGELSSVTDPRGVVTTYQYDPMGRVTLRIVNNEDLPTTSETRDNDIYTRMTYGKASDATWEDKLWTDVDGDGVIDAGTDQVTTYTYGAVALETGASSPSATIGDWIGKVTFPDSGGTSDVVTYTYLSNGAIEEVLDQAGVALNYSYDNAGRLRSIVYSESVMGTTYDDHVDRISYVYDGFGRLETVTQFGGVTTRDQVKIEYDDWGNLAKLRQDHNSTVGGTQLYDVSFSHALATTGGNVLRRTGVTLPNSNAIDYIYSSASGSLDDAANRVSSIRRGGNTDYVEYGYLGLDHVVGIEYPVADVFRRHYGTTAGTYPTLDRFDRVVQDRWTKDLTTDRHFYDQDWTYDRNHNPTVADDHVHATLFDMAWTIDDLNRVVQAERGQWGGSSISTLAEDELWTLTTVGGWALHQLDGDGDGTFTGASDLDVEGTLNVANELTTRLDKAPNPDVTDTLSYNDRGDLTNDGRNYKYTYDAFGRLRMVHNQSDVLVAEYRYNGLGYLIGIRYDSTNPAGLDSSDPWLHLVYDDQWRVVAEHWGSETKPDAIYVHHAGGVAGSGSYIDELAFRERDYDNDTNKVLEERRYYAQNWRKDVVAMLDASGGLVEQVRYSSYGVPYGLPAGDTDSDGDFDSADVAAITGGYDVRKDANLDGSIDVFDVLHASNMAGGGGTVTTGRDVLGSPDNANRFGYGAYLRDPAVPQWHVRHRVFRSDIGRWLTRDPAGYVDGWNLYQYVGSKSVLGIDPDGLQMMPIDEDGGGGGSRPKRYGPYPLMPPPVRLLPDIRFRFPGDQWGAPGIDVGSLYEVCDILQRSGQKFGTCYLSSHGETSCPLIMPAFNENTIREIRRYRQSPQDFEHLPQKRKQLEALDNMFRTLERHTNETRFVCCAVGSGPLLDELNNLYPGTRWTAPRNKIIVLPTGTEIPYEGPDGGKKSK